MRFPSISTTFGVAVLVGAASLLAGVRAPAQAFDDDCLQTNSGKVCKTVEQWECEQWTTTSATFGWTSVGTTGVCSRYVKTTEYFYNKGDGGGIQDKQLF